LHSNKQLGVRVGSPYAGYWEFIESYDLEYLLFPLLIQTSFLSSQIDIS
jgi:hypothetical protein